MNLMCELHDKDIYDITIFTHYEFIKILTDITAKNLDVKLMFSHKKFLMRGFYNFSDCHFQKNGNAGS
jgi:hypothetical protein